jgi:DNA-binding transcriptional LysR family regulator
MNRWTLEDIKIFCAVAEAGSMSAASESANLSTPAISAKIKSLEAALEVALFDRRSSGVEITAAGKRLLAHAHDLLEKADLLTEDIRDFGSEPRGVVRLAANTTAVTEYLPALLASYMAQKAKVDIALSEAISSEVVRQVREGRSDVGIYTPGPAIDDLQTMPFRTDRLALIVHNSHLWVQRSSMSFSESLIADHVCLQRTAALSRFLQHKADEAGRQLRGRIYLTGFEAVARMVGAGVGVAVIPQSAALRLSSIHPIHVVQLTDAWAENELRIVVREFSSLSVAAQTLCTALQKASFAAE